MRCDWFKEFKQIGNIIGLLGLLVGAVGIYYAFDANKEAHISYFTTQVQVLDQSRLLISKSLQNKPTENVPFSVYDSNGHRIEENIYAAEISVWNSGTLDLGSEKVRRALAISIADKPRIIDASIIYCTNQNVSEIKIANNPIREGQMKFAWKYLDPKEGFKVRLVYASQKMENIDLDGAIFGIDSFINTSVPKGRLSYRSPGFPQLVGSGICMILCMFCAGWRVWKTKNGHTGGRTQVKVLMTLFTIGALVLEVWASFSFEHPPTAPF